MPKSPIKIEKTTITTLKKLKRHFRVKNVDAVILKLIKDRKTRENRIKTLERQIADGLEGPPKSEAPTPDDKPELPQATPESPVTRTYPCPFYSTFADNIDEVRCSKDFDRNGRVYRVTPEICTQCWDRQKRKRRKIKDASTSKVLEETPCLCRYEHESNWFCLLKPPTPKKLEHGLKTCQTCQDRLTHEKVQREAIRIEVQRYLMCGAKEVNDRKKGLMVYSTNKACPHKGEWITPHECETAKCHLFKKVETKVRD